MIEINSESLPGLYQAANQASLNAQKSHFNNLATYLVLLIVAAFVSFMCPNNTAGAILSALLFLAALAILIKAQFNRPEEIWYNGRAVAESVKTRSWRWMMRAEPYIDAEKDLPSRQLIGDLKSILAHNKSISQEIDTSQPIEDAITDTMRRVRDFSVADRLEIYLKWRIQDQAIWYGKKSAYNKKRGREWFAANAFLHFTAICMLFIHISDPTLELPVEVIATAAGGSISWLQAKKHNELRYSYALTAHEITLIKGESQFISNEKELSEFVLNSENAFSREHTQWVARKTE